MIATRLIDAVMILEYYVLAEKQCRIDSSLYIFQDIQVQENTANYERLDM